MKFMHLSDLHIGKRVNEFSMIEEQEYIMTKIINILDEEKIEAVLMAGDIYDKPVPSAEAVQLFDDFLTRLAKRDIPIFVISGNHDSAERIAFGGRLMNSRGVYMSPVFDGTIEPIEIEDQFGSIDVYLLPFIKPVYVKKVYPEVEIESYNEAVKEVISHLNVDTSKRNIMIAHQFVTGAERCESEDITVGGLDNVDATLFEEFDYVALGHIHGPQSIKKETIRYCGTPLKYSFSEVNHKKSVTIVDVLEKGTIKISTRELIPRREMRKIKGTYKELTAKDNYEGTNTQDYLHITLTDEEDIMDALGKLRSIYPNIMQLEYDNTRTRTKQNVSGANLIKKKSPLELFDELYELQNNQKMSEEQQVFAQELIDKIWGECNSN